MDDPAGLLTAFRAGEPRALARAISRCESGRGADLIRALYPLTGRALTVGLTGPPGVGKSTLSGALIAHVRAQGKTVGVISVDPSSPFSHGALLGDRIRLLEHFTDPDVFIRSMASRGHLGGLSGATADAVSLMDAFGKDVVLIETVGVGQSETMVADTTDCFLALMLPGAGDELQGIKRGLLELVDVIAVNKADGATRLAAELAARQCTTALQSLAGRDREMPVVLTCSALDHRGVDAVWDAIERRYLQAQSSGGLAALRKRQSLRWLWAIVEDRLRQSVRTHPAVTVIREQLETGVLEGAIPPEAAARQILQAFGLV